VAAVELLGHGPRLGEQGGQVGGSSQGNRTGHANRRRAQESGTQVLAGGCVVFTGRGRRDLQRSLRVLQSLDGGGRTAGQVGGVHAGVGHLAGQRQVARVQRTGAHEQLPQLARHLHQLGQAEDVGAPGRVARELEDDVGVVRHSAGPVAREVVEEAQLELGRSGRRRRDRRRADVQRGQSKDSQVRLAGRLVARPGVASADTHSCRRPEQPRGPGFERRLESCPQLRLVRGPALRRGSVRIEQHEQAMRDADSGPRRPGNLRLGRRRLATRQGVDRGPGPHGIALDEVVDALGGQQVAERVDGVVDRAQLGVDRLLLGATQRGQSDLRVAERDRARIPAPVLRPCAPAPAQGQPVHDVVGPHGLRCPLAQLSTQLVQPGAGGRHRRPRLLELRLEVGDRLLERADSRVGDAELGREVAHARLGRVTGCVRRVERPRQPPDLGRRGVDLCLQRRRDAGLGNLPIGQLPGRDPRGQVALADAVEQVLQRLLRLLELAGQRLGAGPRGVQLGLRGCEVTAQGVLRCLLFGARGGDLLLERAEAGGDVGLAGQRIPQLGLGLGGIVQGRERAQRGDVAVELQAGMAFVEAPLEPVSEQRAERLALADAVQQRKGEPHPP
jgi:hypothetical protein